MIKSYLERFIELVYNLNNTFIIRFNKRENTLLDNIL